MPENMLAETLRTRSEDSEFLSRKKHMTDLCVLCVLRENLLNKRFYTASSQ